MAEPTEDAAEQRSMSVDDDRGSAVAIGRCYSCRRHFAFHPRKVPSYAVDGRPYPVCAICMNRINQKRATMGLPAFPILDGAYDVASEVEVFCRPMRR